MGEQVINMMKMKLKNNGFSLIELIIVIAILAILVAIIAPNLMQYTKRARRVRDLQGAQIIGETLERICAVDPEAATEWNNMTNKSSSNHVEYIVNQGTEDEYILTNVFEFSMTREGMITGRYWQNFRDGQIRNARNANDCPVLYEAMKDELKTNIASMAYQDNNLHAFRCAKNLNNGRVEVWACYTPPGTDGEGVTNGYIQYRLWPDPDPNYLQGDYVEPIHACRYNKVVQ